MTDAPDDTIPAGTVLSERYRVESLLGRGAMGAVYLVEHVQLKKRLALKVLLPEVSANAEIVARFEREAMAAAHIDHPNVVAATDFGRTPDGAFFLVLEYVDGESLRQALQSGGHFEPRRAVHIGMQIARALARAHTLGIVHRDLKPDNVMLVRRDGPDEVVKVLDFGIAKLTGIAVPEDEKVLTRVGAVFGTPEYMAPEQAMGQAVDARADLYALGVTLYELLTGKRPFESDNAVVLLTMHVTAVPPPMSVRAPGIKVPPELETLVMRLLSKSPDDRLATAQEVERALDAVFGSDERAPNTPRIAVAPPSAPASAPDLKSGPGSTRSPGWVATDGAARTNLAIASSTAGATRGASRLLLEISARVRAIDAEWLKARKKWVAPAAAVAVALVLLLVLLFRSPAKPGTSPGTAAATDAGVPTASWSPFASLGKVSDAKIEAAAKSGGAALAELERQNPKDARVLREVVRWHAARSQNTEALAAMGRLAAVDEAAVATPEMGRVLDMVLNGGDSEDADTAIRLLEGPFGARGVDVLMDRATEAGPLKAKILRSLRKPEVRAHASPAAGITLDLREAKTCDAKRDLLERAQTVGDARTLAHLTTLKRSRGCGFLGTADCWRCLRKDGALEDAIAALDSKR